jgi:hypothetical protein
MSRRLAPVLAVLAAAMVAGCGSGSSGESAATCQDDRARLAAIPPVNDLGDARSALRQVIAVERRALARLRASGKPESSSTTQLLLAAAAAKRSLQEINGDAQGAMDPVRTGVPAARRAVAIADGLLRPLCAPG